MIRLVLFLVGFCLISLESTAQQIRNLTQANTLLTETNAIQPCLSVEPDLTIRNIFVDQSNLKYLATKSKGILKLIDCGQVYQSLRPSQQSYAIGQDLSGDIWAATSGNRLINLSQEKVIVLPLKEGEAYVNFIHFSKNYIWVGTLTEGLILLNAKGEKPSPTDTLAQLLRKKLSPQNTEVYDLFVDKNNVYWIATGYGLFKINADLINGDFVGGLEGKIIKSITGDEKGIWFSALGELWNLDFDRDSLRTVPLKKELGVIEDMTFDHNHHLWIAADVVAQYQNPHEKGKENLKVFDSRDGFVSRKATCLSVDQDNAIWVGTSGSGVFVLLNDEHNKINFFSIQSFEQTSEGLTFDTKADQVTVFKINYQIREALRSENLTNLKFFLVAKDGKRYPLSEVGIAETYDGAYFSRNFKIADGQTLQPGKYTLEMQLDGHPIGKQEYELF